MKSPSAFSINLKEMKKIIEMKSSPDLLKTTSQHNRSFQWLVLLLFTSLISASLLACGLVENPHPPVIRKQNCANCHIDRYFGLKSHSHAELNQDCSSCHNKSVWNPSTIHANLKLVGKHRGDVSCESCHNTKGKNASDFGVVSQACYSCHKKDYDNSKQPIHKLPAYPHTCEKCHSSQTAWRPAKFTDHDTFYPLIGKHKAVNCTSCHVNDVYSGTPRDCYACHKKDYEETTKPKHSLTAHPPGSCDGCHTPVGWVPAKFDHDTFFKLNGKHKALACNKCHINDKFKGTPKDCFSCHTKDYTRAGHTEATFPKASCSSCHTEDAWKPAKFDHDTFFKLNGKHKTTACNKCHINGKFKGTPKDCYACHKADYDRATPPHSDGAFPKGSCASCHSESAWKPAIFNHERIFPIRKGDHRRLQNNCSACHIDPKNYKNFSCMTGGCHRKSEMDEEHRDEGVRGYIYNAKNCYRCHPDGESD